MSIREVKFIRNMKLIVISNPINLNNEHALLCSLFESGLEYYHLRKPDFTVNEVEEYIQQIPQQYLNKVVLHSHHQLAIKYKVKGVHFTHKNPYKRSDNFPTNMHRSASFHSLEELKNTESIFQYVFLSPVFDSISKKNHKTKIDKTALKFLLEHKTNKPEKIALGGINEHTISEAMEMGFDGIAVLGAIWMSGEPVKKFKHLLNVCNTFHEIKKENHV